LASQSNLAFAAVYLTNEQGKEQLFITYPNTLTDKQIQESKKIYLSRKVILMQMA
jgi:hypothetical protein